MNKYIAKKYQVDKSTPMGNTANLMKEYDNVIDLSIGDPDVTTHEDIINFAFSEAKAGHTKYTDVRGYKELRDEIISYYTERFNEKIIDEEVMVVTSACLGMYMVLEAILDDGDEVLVPSPYFTPYIQQVELAGGVVRELITKEEDDFNIDITELEKCITDKTKAIIINSPNNPTGNVISKENLEKIVDIAQKYDLVIVADEIYTIYTFDEPFASFINIPKAKDRLIILNSFSKDFTMTGWRLGYIIAAPDIIKVICAINENLVFTAPSISQRAAIYALRHRDKIQATFIDMYKERVLYAAKRINKIKWMSVLKPKGSFYLFVNIKASGLTDQEVSMLLLKEAQVMTIPGVAFGNGGKGYIRIACTVGKEKLCEAFDRIEKIIL